MERLAAADFPTMDHFTTDGVLEGLLDYASGVEDWKLLIEFLKSGGANGAIELLDAGGFEIEDRDEFVKLLEVVEGIARDGVQLSTNMLYVREDNFIEHTKLIAEYNFGWGPDAEWPTNHIDWPAAAAELRKGYTTRICIDGTWFCGEEY